MKLAIVFDIPWSFRQIVDSCSRSRGASCQTSELTDLFKQPIMDQFGRRAKAGIVMHLPQIRLGAQPPGFGELALSICAYLSVTDGAFIQEPRDLSPAAQGFLQVNLVWSSDAEQQEQFPGQRLLPNRLRVQKRGEHCLLDFAKLYTSRLSLDIPRR